RHRCFHERTRIYGDGLQPRLTTEYVDNYPCHGNICPPSSLKPKHEFQQHPGKMDGTSIFKTDYLPYGSVKRHFRPPQEYKPKSGKIDLGTIYRKDYNPHKIGPVTLARPRERKHTTDAKLDTIPTYRDDYRLREAERTESCKVEHTYQPPTERFGNPSTFQDDYIPKELNPPESFKPPAAKPPDGPFDGTTIHRTAYVIHELGPKFIRPKDEYKPCGQPFEDLTTHQRDYKGIPGQLAKSCKPEHKKVGSDAPFDGITEFQDRYQPWLVSSPEFHKPREYVPPTERMDLNSSNRLDYVTHEISPAAPIRPPRRKAISAPFQGNTTTKEDFKPWGFCRQELIKKEQEIPKPKGKFADLTTFRSHYIPHQAPPAQSCKPVCAVGPNEVPFQDETIYRIEYTPKKKEACAAHHPSTLGYVYVNTDAQGHQFFRRPSPEPSVPNCNPIPNEVAVVT
ncbi:SAXO2 protein, partial [Scytalopus superciliaris]|nr:SAXO2 protein [Scytalopus superciliaris]